MRRAAADSSSELQMVQRSAGLPRPAVLPLLNRFRRRKLFASPPRIIVQSCAEIGAFSLSRSGCAVRNLAAFFLHTSWSLLKGRGVASLFNNKGV